jgi:regulator of RNase E activity RraB
MHDAKKTEHTQLVQVQIDNEIYYKITDVDKMRPFFMSILSDSNHWMFIGSNGGLSAGRKNAEYALFPYYTDDKIIESSELTGSKTIFRIQKGDKLNLWEPFSIRYANLYNLQRNLYKSIYGNMILFEETNHDLNLTFQYQWSLSNSYGFVRSSRLLNDNADEVHVSVLDGIQNIMPYGVGSALQSDRSNLVDAYKRSELEKDSGIGIFALSAIIVDKAEPSEALKVTIAWSIGLENPKRLLSALQLDSFRNGFPIKEEEDIKAEKGAFFIHTDIILESKSKKEWILVADVNQNASQIIALAKALQSDKHLRFRIKEDIESGTEQLIRLNAAADGLQLTADKLRDTRHFFNVMFNIMRGGIFDNNYQLEKSDLRSYLLKANHQVFERHKESIQNLPNQFSLSAVKELVSKSDDNDLKRLCLEYLPLKFSRRHGDPSRPWNQFSINTRNENDGSKVLDYAGNWRDIFQNWEALAHSYPAFIEGMIFKFLNASTFDGYNPYRITKNGIDWERIEADDPWSYIGYWGDHQIIYLLKFLEFSESHVPGRLAGYFNDDIFVYANVPYKIKRYEEILKNPKDTIDFDRKLDHTIENRWSALGSDSALLPNKNGTIHHVNFIEKILATVLAKLSNFIPEGGIWMNTQRPEWNDANNALVGNGVSLVTLCYLRRFVTFFKELLERSQIKEVRISEELKVFFENIRDILLKNQHLLAGSITNKDRKTILDGLGLAGSNYRALIYDQSFSDQRSVVPIKDLIEFSSLCLSYLDHTIRANKRTDNLYHSYNLMTVENGQEVSIAHLSEMLEGQVAVLSSGYLKSHEAVETLDALKASALFREDQFSYLLYPNKDLPGFLRKNNIPKSELTKSSLLTNLVKDSNTLIVEQDTNGGYHFNGNFKNGSDLRKAIEELESNRYPVTASDKEEVLTLFEKIFNHKAFTGRSGTFYGYEGLGSIYWHMVSKLQLAVQECCLKAIEDKENESLIGKLLAHYYEINEGIGVHKSPSLYGAFPTDPYSHTPANKGAQQPGMTGQVKEDILSRFGELGVVVKDGQLHFNPAMLKKSEFLSKKQLFSYVDVQGKTIELPLEDKSLGFTYCQVPVIYTLAEENGLEVVLNNGSVSKSEISSLDRRISQKIFDRTGDVVRIVVRVNQMMLR